MILDGLVKSPSTGRGRVSPDLGRAYASERVEPFEFTSNGGGGEALPRRVKRRGETFYEVVTIDRHMNNTF
jgi:hypothetical protein